MVEPPLKFVGNCKGVNLVISSFERLGLPLGPMTNIDTPSSARLLRVDKDIFAMPPFTTEVGFTVRM